MRRKLLALSLIVNLLGFFTPVLAAPDSNASYHLATKGVQRTLFLPAAADNSPVISLGEASDPASGEVVEGYAFIHYKSAGAKAGGATKCYAYLSRGTKWRTQEPWIVNTANTRGLDGAFVFSNLASDITKWEDAGDGILGNGISVNILGNGSETIDTLVADTTTPDNKNEVYFANVSTQGAIAVTIVWFNRFTKQLIEWDQVYDDVDYDWSSSGEAGKMDFENIATHELGHSVGLGDLYTSSCTEETMYGYASLGETKKRDLNQGDIAGINALY